MARRLVTFAVDDDILSEKVAEGGDGAKAIGPMLVKAMLAPNDVNPWADLGMAACGIALTSVKELGPFATGDGDRG